jgi:hypothetical protein
MGTAVKIAICGSSSIRSFANSFQSMRGETPLRQHFKTLPSGPKTRNTFWSLVAIIARRAAGVTLNLVCSGALIRQQERRCQVGSVDLNQSVRHGSKAGVCSGGDEFCSTPDSRPADVLRHRRHGPSTDISTAILIVESLGTCNEMRRLATNEPGESFGDRAAKPTADDDPRG